jgi:hypothetical protein
MLPEPFAEMITTVPPALAPNVMPPLAAVLKMFKVPDAVMAPDVVIPALLDIETLFPLEGPLPIFGVLPPVPTKVTLPVVLNVKLLVVPVTLVMSPEPEVRFKFVAVIEPPVCVIMPEPLAVKFTVVPPRLKPRETLPLFAVVASDRLPAAERADAVESVLLLLMDRLLNVAPDEARLSEPPLELITVALPVVLRVKSGVDVLMLPILPEADVRAKEVLPVSVPAT